MPHPKGIRWVKRGKACVEKGRNLHHVLCRLSGRLMLSRDLRIGVPLVVAQHLRPLCEDLSRQVIDFGFAFVSGVRSAVFG